MPTGGPGTITIDLKTQENLVQMFKNIQGAIGDLKGVFNDSFKQMSSNMGDFSKHTGEATSATKELAKVLKDMSSSLNVGNIFQPLTTGAREYGEAVRQAGLHQRALAPGWKTRDSGIAVGPGVESAADQAPGAAQAPSGQQVSLLQKIFGAGGGGAAGSFLRGMGLGQFAGVAGMGWGAAGMAAWAGTQMLATGGAREQAAESSYALLSLEATQGKWARNLLRQQGIGPEAAFTGRDSSMGGQLERMGQTLELSVRKAIGALSGRLPGQIEAEYRTSLSNLGLAAHPELGLAQEYTQGVMQKLTPVQNMFGRMESYRTLKSLHQQGLSLPYASNVMNMMGQYGVEATGGMAGLGLATEKWGTASGMVQQMAQRSAFLERNMPGIPNASVFQNQSHFYGAAGLADPKTFAARGILSGYAGQLSAESGQMGTADPFASMMNLANTMSSTQSYMTGMFGNVSPTDTAQAVVAATSATSQAQRTPGGAYRMMIMASLQRMGLTFSEAGIIANEQLKGKPIQQLVSNILRGRGSTQTPDQIARTLGGTEQSFKQLNVSALESTFGPMDNISKAQMLAGGMGFGATKQGAATAAAIGEVAWKNGDPNIIAREGAESLSDVERKATAQKNAAEGAFAERMDTQILESIKNSGLDQVRLLGVLVEKAGVDPKLITGGLNLKQYQFYQEAVQQGGMTTAERAGLSPDQIATAMAQKKNIYHGAGQDIVNEYLNLPGNK